MTTQGRHNMTTHHIKELDINDLLKIHNTSKGYIAFNISVFNVGSVTRISCTNDYSQYKNISQDGYSYILENNQDLQDMVVKELSEHAQRISSRWLMYCYELTFREFLQRYKISYNTYQKIKDL